MKQCRIRGKLHFIMLMKLQCLFLDYFIWIWSLVIQEYRQKTIAYKYFCILPIFARQNKVCILICNKLQFIFWIKSIATFIDMYFIQIMDTAWSNFSSNRLIIKNITFLKQNMYHLSILGLILQPKGLTLRKVSHYIKRQRYAEYYLVWH